MKVYTYESLDRPSRHCREEVAVELENGRLADTFWMLSSETHMLTEPERATAVFQFDTDDYDELDQYSRNSKPKWMEYREGDRKTISSQHGLRMRWFVRKGAQPDIDTKIENARDDLAAAESKLRSATSGVEWAQKELDRLLDEAGNNPETNPASTSLGEPS